MNQKIKINLDNTTKIKQFIKVTRSFLPEHSSIRRMHFYWRWKNVKSWCFNMERRGV